MNKIDVNSPGNSIYVSGLGGTSKFEMIGDQITPTARQEGTQFAKLSAKDYSNKMHEDLS